MNLATKSKRYISNLLRVKRDLKSYAAHDVSSMRQVKNDVDYDEFHEKGIVVLKGFLSKEDCDKLVAKMEYWFSNAENVITDELKSDSRIFGIDRIEKDYKELLDTDHINQMLNDYLTTRSSFLMANRVKHVEGNLGSGGGWHRDSYLFPQIKLITYLSDVNEDNGPFEYIPGTHRLNNKKSDVFKGNYEFDANRSVPSRFSDKSIKAKYSQNDIFRVTGQKGTAVLVDTSGIHRGMPIKSGVRYAAQIFALCDNTVKNTLTRNIKALFTKKRDLMCK